MWFDGIRRTDTLYVASVSRGKDSTAMLRAIQLLGFPLDGIISTDVWFDDDTPAELPEMVAFKDEWDRKCLENFGVPVTRVCATTTLDKKHNKNSQKPIYDGGYKCTYVDRFNRTVVTKKHGRHIDGFPKTIQPWCKLLKDANDKRSGIQENIYRLLLQENEFDFKNRKINIVYYIGIAADEPIRIEKHIHKKDKVLPLVQIGWDEDLCGLIAQYMGMLSPTYENSSRDGCWFCHNQGIGQLRNLRKNHPDLWSKLMAIDCDSPVSFRPDGHTVHDFDKRFALEEIGALPTDRTFRWKMLDSEELQLRLPEV